MSTERGVYRVVPHKTACTSLLLRDGKLIATFQSHLTVAQCEEIGVALNQGPRQADGVGSNSDLLQQDRQPHEPERFVCECNLAPCQCVEMGLPAKTGLAPEPLAVKFGHDDTNRRYAEFLAESAIECTRSHPHENMSWDCERLTEIARLTAELSEAQDAAMRHATARGELELRLASEPEPDDAALKREARYMLIESVLMESAAYLDGNYQPNENNIGHGSILHRAMKSALEK